MALFKALPLKKLLILIGPATHSLNGSNTFSANNFMLANSNWLGVLSSPLRVAVVLYTPSLSLICLLIILFYFYISAIVTNPPQTLCDVAFTATVIAR